MINSTFFLFTIFSIVMIVLSTGENPCHPKYASQTKSTNECVCLSRNCEGPQCQSSQGFVWYNYIKCPSCKCIAPKLKETSTQIQNEDPIPVKSNPTDDRTQALNKQKPEEEETWQEWLVDNMNSIFAFCAGSIVTIIVALYVFMSFNNNAPVVETKSTDNGTKTSENNLKSSTTTAEIKESKKS